MKLPWQDNLNHHNSGMPVWQKLMVSPHLLPKAFGDYAVVLITKGIMIEELKMVIYQVVDEQNHPIGEYQNFENAKHNAEDMTLWFSDHYYHVEELVFEEA